MADDEEASEEASEDAPKKAKKAKKAKKEKKAKKAKEGEEGEEGAKKKKKGGKKKILILLVVGVGGYMMFGRSSGASADESPPIPLSEEAEGAVVEVGTLTVNLADEAPRYVKVGVALVLVEGADPLSVAGKFPLVLDAVLTEISSMTAVELLSDTGFEEAKRRIGDQAIGIYNEEAVYDEETGTETGGVRTVKRIVLTELLVQ